MRSCGGDRRSASHQALLRSRLVVRAMAFAIGQELVELLLIFGATKLFQERLKVTLIFFETAQQRVAIFVERDVAARPPAVTVPMTPPFPMFLEVPAPTFAAAMRMKSPTTHRSAPNENGEADQA